MISRLLFDLDNTLYPESSGFEGRIVDRMTAHAAEWLGLSLPETEALRARALTRYGTTLEWLMAEHGFRDVELYYTRVHPAGEEEILAPDPALDALLASVDLPKAVFTNAPMEHALRVLKRLGIEGRFERVWDIRFCGMKGKPRREAFQAVLADWGVGAEGTLFFDDNARSCRTFIGMGGRAVLVDEDGSRDAADLLALKSIHAFPACLN